MQNRKTLKERFSVQLHHKDVVAMIHKQIYQIVKERGHTMVCNEEIQNIINLAAKWFIDPTEKPWLLLCGNVGNGKTTMLKAIGQVLSIYQLPLSDEFGYDYGNSYSGPCRPILQIRNAKDIFYESRCNYDAQKRFYNIPMLGIDDFGTEPREGLDFGTTITPMIDLITYRYENNLFTAFTSNLAVNKVRETYGDRVADRLNEMIYKITFCTDSFRSLGNNFSNTSESKETDK